MLPCLLVSTLGANLNAEVFRAGYPLFFWGLLHQLIGLLVGHLARRLGNIPDSFGREFSSACAFGNCGSLPLVVVETLARQPPLSNNSESLERMTTYVFLCEPAPCPHPADPADPPRSSPNPHCIIPKIDNQSPHAFPAPTSLVVDLTSWFMSFWSVGILYLAPNLSDRLENDGAETPATATARGGCKRVLSHRGLLAMCNPLMGAVLLGLLIGLVQPLQDLFFSDQAPLRFVSSAVETLGKPAIGVVTILMSASLGAFWDKYWTLRAVATSVEARGIRRGGSEVSETPAPAPANLDGGAGAAGAGGTAPERQSVSGRTPSYTDATSTAGAGAGDDGAAVLVAGVAAADHVPFQSMITLAVVRTVGVHRAKRPPPPVCWFQDVSLLFINWAHGSFCCVAPATPPPPPPPPPSTHPPTHLSVESWFYRSSTWRSCCASRIWCCPHRTTSPS